MAIPDEIRRIRAAKYQQWLGATKYNAREDNVPCKIEEGLYLGSVKAAYNKKVLKGLNISHILIVSKSLKTAYPNDFIYKKIEVHDTPETNLEQYFVECIEFIDEAKREGDGVLVHCHAGISRSATIVVAYLIKKHQMSISDALSLVRSKRPQIAPNLGFMTQLENFEKSLRGKKAKKKAKKSGYALGKVTR